MDVIDLGFCLRMRSVTERQLSLPTVVYDVEVLVVCGVT